MHVNRTRPASSRLWLRFRPQSQAAASYSTAMAESDIELPARISRCREASVGPAGLTGPVGRGRRMSRACCGRPVVTSPELAWCACIDGADHLGVARALSSPNLAQCLGKHHVTGLPLAFSLPSGGSDVSISV